MKEAIDLVIKERMRQVDKYGYTDEHIKNSPEDYGDEELARAAAVYSLPEGYRFWSEGRDRVSSFFPWDNEYWKPSPDDRIKELTKAGAMIVAEITRLLNTEK